MMKGRKNFEMMLAREKAGLSQEVLAERVGSKRLWINAIENNKGKPSLDLAKKIAKELGKTTDELFGDDIE